MSRYEDNELVRLYEEYWTAARWTNSRGRTAIVARQRALRYRQGTAAMIVDRIARYHS